VVTDGHWRQLVLPAHRPARPATAVGARRIGNSGALVLVALFWLAIDTGSRCRPGCPTACSQAGHTVRDD
jgi:hypothetical protein